MLHHSYRLLQKSYTEIEKREKKRKEIYIKHGEFKNVSLTEEEYNKLIEKNN